jgi:hypothetical protein
MKLARVTTQKLSTFSGGQQRLNRRMAVSYRKPNHYVSGVYNFRESSEVHDWRIKEMVDVGVSELYLCLSHLEPWNSYCPCFFVDLSPLLF